MLRLLLLCLYFFAALGFSSAQAAKPVLVVGIGFSDQVNMSRKGSNYHLDVLLCYRLFTELGYQVKFIVAPYAKLTRLLQQRQIDVATRQSGQLQSNLYYSPVYLQVHNLVFARQNFSGTIKTIQDLKAYPLVGFQNASHVLGQEFAKVSREAPSYREVFDHIQAVQLLLKGRTELLVLNKKTFYRRLAELQQPTSLVRSFDVLPQVEYRLAFSAPKLQQEVEPLLQKYLQQGAISDIEQQALKAPEQVEKLLRRQR
ncbi:substrate-binding periplasmic protein [Rheinheimera sp. 4Y26]|uniref:substrate-binding periplasmic protein n=1 Tax=Rheinheimera sp. 4Y26 TaxID=2977811 RepID=UPI0021B10830|nr:transporter substrate-binding domain-containing protein [Rheinheimera sp. 4Y26]MCT6698682.1 transporter substrate-binding domain-containing protein [Rheinheimera sp. 4Y26]